MKREAKCSKCGILGKEHPEIIDFHHSNHKEKKYSITNGNFANHSEKVIEEEIAKCVFLCSNCHRIVHHKDEVFKWKRKI